METQEFEQLVRMHNDTVRAFIWRRSSGLDVGVSEPDDIAAEVWAVAWQRREAAPGAGDNNAATAWLLQIARHLLANHIRKTDTRRRISNTLRQEELTLASAESLVLGDETLREVFACLTPGEKEVMSLTLWEGLRPSEIAAVIGTSDNAVSLRLHKARQKIAEVLASQKEN